MATTASANKTIQKATPPDRLLKLWGEMLRTQKLHNGQTDTYHPSRILAEGNLVTATTHPVPPPHSFALAADSSAASLAPAVAVKEAPNLCGWEGTLAGTSRRGASLTQAALPFRNAPSPTHMTRR